MKYGYKLISIDNTKYYWCIKCDKYIGECIDYKNKDKYFPIKNHFKVHIYRARRDRKLNLLTP